SGCLRQTNGRGYIGIGSPCARGKLWRLRWILHIGIWSPCCPCYIVTCMLPTFAHQVDTNSPNEWSHFIISPSRKKHTCKRNSACLHLLHTGASKHCFLLSI